MSSFQLFVLSISGASGPRAAGVLIAGRGCGGVGVMARGVPGSGAMAKTAVARRVARAAGRGAAPICLTATARRALRRPAEPVHTGAVGARVVAMVGRSRGAAGWAWRGRGAGDKRALVPSRGAGGVRWGVALGDRKPSYPAGLGDILTNLRRSVGRGARSDWPVGLEV